MRALTFLSTLALLGGIARADDGQAYIVVVHRDGEIEFIDPATLKTVSRIDVTVPAESTGLDGIFVSPDSSTLYFEGPIGPGHEGANNCCWLYSLDLGTLETKKVAGIFGTRDNIFIADGVVYPIGESPQYAKFPKGDAQWHFSPDRKWLVGVGLVGVDGSQRALDLLDLSRGSSSLVIDRSPNDTWPSGAWLGNRFYFYDGHADGSGPLQILVPEEARLESEMPVSIINRDCSRLDFAEMTSAAGRLFLYEGFGGKLDSRWHCGDATPGGATAIDPATGNVLDRITPELHFWKLIPSLDKSELYGLSSESSESQKMDLVRIDAQSGRVLELRSLDEGYWWIVTARFGKIPANEVSVNLPEQ